MHSDSQISKPQIPNRSDQRIRERFQWVLVGTTRGSCLGQQAVFNTESEGSGEPRLGGLAGEPGLLLARLGEAGRCTRARLCSPCQTTLLLPKRTRVADRRLACPPDGKGSRVCTLVRTRRSTRLRKRNGRCARHTPTSAPTNVVAGPRWMDLKSSSTSVRSRPAGRL